MVDNFPDVPKENEPQRVPQAWLQEEVEQLLSTISGLDGTMRGTTIPNWLWWRTLVMVILDTGERIGAVRQAEWDWVSAESILIPAEFRKGGKRDKWFPLSPDTQQLLVQLRHITDDKRKVFPWHYCEMYIWTQYRSILEKAGLPTGRKCGFHRHRKTHASVAYAAGLDPQELLDHCDRRTTQRYLDARFSRKTQASDILADWLRNPPTTEKRKQA
jgi:integrase